MRKISLIGFVMLIVSIPTFAGDLSNKYESDTLLFLRMLARGATIEIDGAYSPILPDWHFFPKDGFQVALDYSECISDS